MSSFIGLGTVLSVLSYTCTFLPVLADTAFERIYTGIRYPVDNSIASCFLLPILSRKKFPVLLDIDVPWCQFETYSAILLDGYLGISSSLRRSIYNFAVTPMVQSPRLRPVQLRSHRFYPPRSSPLRSLRSQLYSPRRTAPPFKVFPVGPALPKASRFTLFGVTRPSDALFLPALVLEPSLPYPQISPSRPAAPQSSK
ncbi:hypothetical protein Tco_1448296 [Tanacetum coccineum]